MRQLPVPHGFNDDPIFSELELGDIITGPNRSSYTIRAKALLNPPVGPMAGFVLAGEMEALFSIPCSQNGPISFYVPIDYIPVDRELCTSAAEGVARYWSPHLPAHGGAMGEVQFRVLTVRGSIDPIVLIYRGDELIVFIRASLIDREQLKVDRMDRSTALEAGTQRHSGLVRDSQRVPDTAPAHLPTPARRRRR